MNKPTICPICGNPIQSYYETDATKPYTHTNPFLGIEIWGTLHDGKQTICCNDQYVHFVFPYNNEHRLVKMGVEETEVQTYIGHELEEEDDYWDDEYFDEDYDHP
jgi:hypothetical protein